MLPMSSRPGATESSMREQLGRLLQQARTDADVLAVVLFGSAARGEAGPASDVDVCLVLATMRRDRLALARKRLAYAMEVDLDVQVFQELPVYVRRRVLRDGRVLFVRDEDALYALACRTARAFELFRPLYRRYLDEVFRA